MSPKECLEQFKEAYCEKSNQSQEFRCGNCTFVVQGDICLINSFIFNKEEK